MGEDQKCLPTFMGHHHHLHQYSGEAKQPSISSATLNTSTFFDSREAKGQSQSDASTLVNGDHYTCHNANNHNSNENNINHNNVVVVPNDVVPRNVPQSVHGDHLRHHNADNYNGNVNNINHDNVVGNNDNIVVVHNDVVRRSHVARNVPQSEYPAGYRFCPLDGELIVHYLMKKIKNQTLPHDKIKEVDLYGANPADLSETYQPVGDREWYFFTPRKRKYPNGIRPNRAAGKGYWKATGADKPVMYGKERVGFRKALVYYQGKPPKGDKTNWIMHEYKADGPQRAKKDANDMTLDDWVLCRIYYKEDKDSKSQPPRNLPKADGPPLPVSDEPNAAMDNNELAAMDATDNLSEHPMNTHGYNHLPGYQNAFSHVPPNHHHHMVASDHMDPSFVDFPNPNNGGLEQPFTYKPIFVNSRSQFIPEASGLRSYCHEDNSLDYMTRGFYSLDDMSNSMLHRFPSPGDVLNNPPSNDVLDYIVTDDNAPEDPSDSPEE